MSPAAEAVAMGFYEVPVEDRHWGVLLNPWRPVGGLAPRERVTFLPVKKHASRLKMAVIDPMLQGECNAPNLHTTGMTRR